MNFEKICRNCPDEPWCIKSRGSGCGVATWETAILLGSEEESFEQNPMDLEQGEQAFFYRGDSHRTLGFFIAYEADKSWYRRRNSRTALMADYWHRPKKERLPKMGDLIVVSNVIFEETDDSGVFALFHSFNKHGSVNILCTKNEEGVDYCYWRFPKKYDFKENKMDGRIILDTKVRDQVS